MSKRTPKVPPTKSLQTWIWDAACSIRGFKDCSLELDQSGIHVAEYLTALPSRDLLQKKLHAAIKLSKARLELHSSDTE